MNINHKMLIHYNNGILLETKEELKEISKTMNLQDLLFIKSLKSLFPWAKYIARDSDNGLFIYQRKPTFLSDLGQWLPHVGEIIRIHEDNFQFIKKETCIKITKNNI